MTGRVADRPGPPPLELHPAAVAEVFDRLYARWGPQGWWPGETPFEVMVGAVLTQNTAWPNVERAIARLTEAALLDPRAICDVPLAELAACLQPAGYFNLKATRLASLCRSLIERGGEAVLQGEDTEALRVWLLGVHGIGPETADDILLYAFDRAVFVVDAYTRRIFGRIGLLAGGEGYERLRAAFETALPADAALFNEYHALIVQQAKAVCRKRPRCADCVLADLCQGKTP